MFGQLAHIVERRIFLAVSVTASFIIISLLPFVFVDAHAMECYQSSDYYYQMILDCTDTIDVKKSTMNYVYSDINRFSKSFEGAKVYNIRTQGSNTFATIEIPLPLVSDLKSDVKFSKSPNYLLEFLTGKLAGSKLYISLSVRDGYDGTKNAGSLVNFKFQVKEVPCYMWGLKCGSASHFEYALDRGLYLLEPLAKKIQLELVQTSSNQNNPKQFTQTITKESGLRGPPIVDFDGDGISDRFDNCKFDKETYNGYLDFDGCPDTKPILQLPTKTNVLKLQSNVNEKIEVMKPGIIQAEDSINRANYQSSQAEAELEKAKEALSSAKRYLADAEWTQKEGETFISKSKFQDAKYKYEYSWDKSSLIDQYLFDITDKLKKADYIEEKYQKSKQDLEKSEKKFCFLWWCW